MSGSLFRMHGRLRAALILAAALCSPAIFAADSVIAQGTVVSPGGIVYPQRFGPQPWRAAPADGPSPRRSADCLWPNKEPYVVPPGQGRLGYDEPGPEIQLQDAGRGSPGDLLIWRSSNVNPTIPGGSAAGFSSTNEPTLGVREELIFTAGNWYAALSTDLGLSWQFVDPYDNFPADGVPDVPGTAAGFCCDQVVFFERSRNLMVWFLQYSTPTDPSGNRIASNVQRLAVARGREALLNNEWTVYDFTPTDFGFAPNTTWLDFPDLQASDNALYFTTNVFMLSGGNSIAGLLVRLDLDELAALGPLQFSYLNTGTSTTRMCSGCTDAIYAGQHLDSDTIRIWRYPEYQSTATWTDVDHTQFDPAGANNPMVAIGPDGRNWAGFDDSRILAAYRAGGELGFLYGARQKAGFPYPYVDVSKFSEDDYGFRRTEAIYSTQFAILYPSVQVNSSLARGGTFAFGGGAYHPGVLAYIVDEYNQFDFRLMSTAAVASGGSGPANNRWGDYFTARQDWLEPDSFHGSGFIMPDPNSVRPVQVWFGRPQATPPGEIAVEAVSVIGGQCHASGTPMTVRVTLRNLGMTAVVIPTVDCRISTDAIIDLSDTPFASQSNVFVAADATQVVELTAVTPLLPNGLYRVGAWTPFLNEPILENNRRVAEGLVAIGPPPAPAPVIVVQPSDVARCPGVPTQIAATIQSPLTPEFRWFRNGALIYSGPAEDLLLLNPKRSDSGFYQLHAVNACGTTVSRDVLVVFGVWVRNGPSSQTVSPCGTATFSVEAYGVGSLNFQWRRNGTPLGADERYVGANSPTLTIVGARYDDEGVYNCVITDQCGPVVSSAAELAVEKPIWRSRNDPSPRPTQRIGTAVVYDPDRRVSVLFGGYGPVSSVLSDYLADHWEYDGVEWVLRTPAVKPPKRREHAMAYDSDRRRVMLFGGYPSGLLPGSSDLWEYDGVTWTLRKPSSDADSPPLMSGQWPLLAYDSLRAKLVMVRGVASGVSSNSETWEYDAADNTWTRVVASNGFPSGYLNRMAFDPSRGVCVLYWTFFGGQQQTWRWNGVAWVRDAITTPHMFDAEMAYDSFRKRCVLFQHYESQSVYPTVSYFDAGADWSLLLPAGPPSSPPNDLYALGMTFDDHRRSLVALLRDYDTAGLFTSFDVWEMRYLDRVLFERNPASSVLVPGQSVAFSVFVSGLGPITYQWRRNGTPLVNGAAPGGGVISGATTSTLSIDPVGSDDAGVYVCVASNACGSATSAGAVLGAPLLGDLDGDGDVDIGDLLALDACMRGPDVPILAGCAAADLDADGDVDMADQAVFQPAFNGGPRGLPGK